MSALLNAKLGVRYLLELGAGGHCLVAAGGGRESLGTFALCRQLVQAGSLVSRQTAGGPRSTSPAWRLRS